MRLVKSFSHVAVYKEDDEFIVRVPGKPEADYFTDDWADADGTAKLMNEQVAKGKVRPRKQAQPA